MGKIDIHAAIRANNIEDVKVYIATGGDLNTVDKLKRTPLHLAAWGGHYDLLELLIKSKAQIDKTAMDSFTAMHFAVQSSSPRACDCIKLLAQKSRSLLYSRISKGNKTALHIAVGRNNEDVVRTLLDLGIDMNATTSSGQSALDLAKTESMREFLQNYTKPCKDKETDVLLEKNCDLDLKDREEIENISKKRSISEVISEDSESKIPKPNEDK